MSPKDTDTGTGHGVVLLDTYAGDDEGHQAALVPAGRPRLAPTVVVAVVVALGALWLTLPAGPDPEQAQPPPTSSAPEPAPAAVGPTLFELTGREVALSVAVTSHQGEAGRLLRWEPHEATPAADNGVDLRQPRFDQSGRWVAGLGVAPRSGGGLVLWAGPVGEPLEPVEVGVRGFAWHDTRPGGLAWTAPSPSGGGSLVVVNLSSAGPHRRARFVDTDDRLRHWGDWGFALSSPNRPFRTTVLDDAAQVVAAGEPGLAIGWTPGWGVAVSGRGAEGVKTLVAGAWTAAEWAEPGEQAMDIAVSPDGSRAAVHLVSTDGGSRGEQGRVVVLGEHEVLGELDDVTYWAAMTWSGDGRTLALARQGSDAGTQVILWDPVTGAETTVAVPGLDPNRDWIEALAVTDEGGRRPQLATEESRP